MAPTTSGIGPTPKLLCRSLAPEQFIDDCCHLPWQITPFDHTGIASQQQPQCFPEVPTINIDLSVRRELNVVTLRIDRELVNRATCEYEATVVVTVRRGEAQGTLPLSTASRTRARCFSQIDRKRRSISATIVGSKPEPRARPLKAAAQPSSS
jgi:hypothetical protein